MKSTKKWDRVYDKTYKAIIKHFKNCGANLLIREVKFDDVANLVNDLEVAGIINFGLYERRGMISGDWWTQCEYFSKKIKRTIIFNYDYQDYFDTLEVFADKLASTEAYISEFENKLLIKKGKK